MSDSDSMRFDGSSSDEYDTDDLLTTAAAKKVPKSKTSLKNSTSQTNNNNINHNQKKNKLTKSPKKTSYSFSSSVAVKKIVKVEKNPKHRSKVVALTNTSKAIKLAEKKSNAVIKLPDHWPVTSQKIKPSQVQSHLLPGNILKKCNGSDIKLSKNSDAKPTVGRGKYLFFLPGLLSFRQPTQTLVLSKDLSQTTADQEMEIHHDSQEESKSGPVKDASGRKISPSTLMSLGTVSNLYTDHPKLSIPLPNGQTLQFVGRKLKCSSKQLILTFKTSGAVNCRNTFQEIVVFGDYSIHGEPSIIQENETLVQEKEGGLENLNHYGGSERAIDGGRDIRGQKKIKIATNNDLSQTQPSQLTQEESATSGYVGNISQDVLSNNSNDDDDDDDDDSDVKIVQSSPLPPRHMPSRKSTSSKKVNYAKLLQSDSSDSEDEQDDASEHNDSESDEEYFEKRKASVPSSRKKPIRSTLKKVNYSQESHSNEDEEESRSSDSNNLKDATSISKQPRKTKNLSALTPAVEVVGSRSAKVKTQSSAAKNVVPPATSHSTDARRHKEDPKHGRKTLSPLSAGTKRKKSTPSSKRKESPSPKKRIVFDISMDDDEFAFMD